MIQVDPQWAVLCFAIWMAISFIIGFDFARWLARKHPEAWKRQLKTDEETLRGLWNKISSRIRR